MFALVLAPFILTTPVHAADDNTASITVDPSAELKSVGNLYKATTNVTIKTGKPYGFNLTMQADTADLLNSKDSTHKISAPQSATPVALGANQWGYSLNKSATTFSAVPADAQAASSSAQSGAQSPATSVTPAVIIDTSVKGKQAGCNCKDHCATTVTFAANIDPAKLASGSYSTAITYTATAKPKPTFVDRDQRTAKVNPSEVCRSGDNNSSCLVDLDKNMIPVKYTGTTTNAQWTSISNPEDEDAKGNWYDYGKKQWANAITVKKEALAKYQGQDKVVDQADVLGYWVYIPRYAYEVMRRDGTDKPILAQNFDIKFENTKTPKKRPLACKTGNGKDYRTECGVSRELPLMDGEVSTWATHPAFSFGKKELNGIWFGKFETTGTTEQPTVLPNNLRFPVRPDGIITNVGVFYMVARSLGINDLKNTGGEGEPGDFLCNNHHLNKLSSYMVNNNDWGAAVYLSASKYGAGYNGVKINSRVDLNDNPDYISTDDIISYVGDLAVNSTGCGPLSDSGEVGTYDDGGVLGTQSACSKDNLQRAYNGILGQLASTTNNVYGIYDMFGGGLEYVAASYSGDMNVLKSSSYIGFSRSAYPPYVNIYNFSNFNDCTYQTCGGQALYETNLSDSDGYNQWNGNRSSFVRPSAPWFMRSGVPSDALNAGLFSTYIFGGNTVEGHAFRVALAPAPHD